MPVRKAWRHTTLKLCLAWALCSALGLLFGDQVLRAAAPLLSRAVAVLAPELMTHVECVDAAGPVPDVLLDARTTRALTIAAGRVIPPGSPLPSRATGVHVLVPLVILFTTLCALPSRGWRERAWLAALALPLAVLVLLATTPFQLLGLIEGALQDYAASAGLERPAPWLYRWMLLLEGGGRWVLPIGLAICGLALARYWGSPRRAP